MTKTEVIAILRQPSATLALIRELHERVRALEDAMLPSGVRYDKDRVQGTRTDPMLIFVERADPLLSEIDDLKRLYIRQADDAERLIGSLDANLERRVLRLRYLRGIPCEQIAGIIHFSDTTVYRLRRAAIRHIIERQKNDSE